MQTSQTEQYPFIRTPLQEKSKETASNTLCWCDSTSTPLAGRMKLGSFFDLFLYGPMHLQREDGPQSTPPPIQQQKLKSHLSERKTQEDSLRKSIVGCVRDIIVGKKGEEEKIRAGLFRFDACRTIEIHHEKMVQHGESLSSVYEGEV
jgi:hypothetical protein